MKIFKYKFSKLVITLIYAGIVLSVVGLGLNVFLIITDDVAASANLIYPIIQYSLMFLIPVVLLVLLISLLCSSYYAIDEKTLKTSFGIIKSKYKIEDIKTILLDRATNKLSVFMNNNSFFVIVVNEQWYEDFVTALCRANPCIEYSINSKESDGNDTEGK